MSRFAHFDEMAYQPQRWQVSLMHHQSEYVVRVSYCGVVVHEDEVFSTLKLDDAYRRARMFASTEVERVRGMTRFGVDFHNYVTGEIRQFMPMSQKEREDHAERAA